MNQVLAILAMKTISMWLQKKPTIEIVGF